MTEKFRLVVKQLRANSNGYRDVLRETYNSKSKLILLDCERDVLPDVLKQSQQVGLISDGYSFLLTSLDSHTLDMEEYKVDNMGQYLYSNISSSLMWSNFTVDWFVFSSTLARTSVGLAWWTARGRRWGGWPGCWARPSWTAGQLSCTTVWSPSPSLSPSYRQCRLSSRRPWTARVNTPGPRATLSPTTWRQVACSMYQSV